MAIRDIKEQVKDAFIKAYEHLKENPLFIRIKEGFEVLPTKQQKLIVSASGFLFIFLLFLVPYSYIQTSSEYITEFEDNRTLIRRLLKSSTAASSALLPKPFPIAFAKSSVTRELESLNLTSEQIKDVQVLDNYKSPRYVPKKIITDAVEITLSKLNLEQVMDVGQKMESLHSTARLIDVDIFSDKKDPHYYNAKYVLVIFNAPKIEELKKSKKKKSRRKKR